MTVAFFDLDYTLLNGSSGLLYIQEAIKQRRLPVWVVGYVGLMHRLKRLDFGEAHLQLIKYVGRTGYQDTQQFFESWINHRLLPRLAPPGRAKIAWHKEQGHRVVLLSASIEEIVAPVAHHLELGSDYIGTRLAVEQDRYTGQLAGPLCYGRGKVYWAKQWCADNQLDFSQTTSYFYTDSSSDVPLLELVKHPVAVNPSRRLQKIAVERGWQIERFY